MSSSGDEGNRQKTEINKDAEKSTELQKSLILRNRSKWKHLKKPHMNCTRCKAIQQRKYLKSEIPKALTILTKDTPSPHPKDKGSLQLQHMKLANNQDASQFQSPPKKVHVEFMESHNLKDFNLNKKNVQHLNSQNDKNLMKLNSENTISNAKPLDVNKPVINSQTKNVWSSSLDLQHKQMQKTKEIDQTKEKTTTENKTVPAPDSNSEEILKKSENIRILYHGHPRRKIKIKVPKQNQVKSGTKTKQVPQQKQDHTVQNASTDKKNSLLTEKYSKQQALTSPVPNKNNEKSTAAHQPDPKSNVKLITVKSEQPFKKSELKVPKQQKPTELKKSSIETVHKAESTLMPQGYDNFQILYGSDSGKKHMSAAKKRLETKGTGCSKVPTKKTVGEIKENPKIYFEYLYVLERIKPAILNKSTDNILGKETFPKIKLNLNLKKQVVNNVKQFLQVHEYRKKSSKKSSFSSNKTDGGNSSVDLQNLEKYFGEYFLPQKQTPKLEMNTHLGMPILEEQHVLKKLNENDSQSGMTETEAVNKNIFKGDETSSKKDRSSKFWHAVTMTVVPFLLVLTGYTITNIGIIETFKHMRYTLTLLHGKSSENVEVDMAGLENSDDNDDGKSN